MEKDLKLEVFASKEPVQSVTLHKYNLHSHELKNPYSIIRSACQKISTRNKCGAFEDGKHIYTTEKIDTEIPGAKFSLEYIGEETPVVAENKRFKLNLET